MKVKAFDNYRRQCRDRVEKTINQLLPAANQLPGRLHEAMRYAALAPGKRVRPLLVYATGRALETDPERLDPIATAVELIHAFSLVHDDLPAMDDDDLRRGRPTCHKAFDEATAILAGDALQTQAFLVLARNGHGIEPAIRLQMIEQLALASGSHGMAGGQALDIAAEGLDLALPELENIHIHKTGALIRTAVNLASLAGGASEEQGKGLDHYAKCIGLAFQIRDDILDEVGDTGILGKTQGKDRVQHKVTYPSLLGLTGAREKASELVAEALESLQPFDQQADALRQLAQYILDRDK